MSRTIEVANLQAGNVEGSNQHPLSTVREFSAKSERAGEMTINGKPSYSVDQAATNLLSGSTPWADIDKNGRIELTYSFPRESQLVSNDDYYTLDIAGLREFSPLQKAQAVLAMQSWSDAANLSFSEAPRGGDGHITFGNYKVGGAAAQTIRPGDASGLGGQSWYSIAEGYADNSSPRLNNHGRQTLAHEVGHVLGLPHPGNYNGAGASYTNNASYAQDTVGYSVMSYWSETSNSQDFTRDAASFYASAPLMDDIAAIQKLYGANWNTRADDTIYGFNANTGRDFLSASQPSDALVFCVWDAGGNDTLDFSGFTQNQKINLHAGSFSDVGGMVGNISIAQGVTVEHALGGSGNDLLLGNDGVNELRGGGGTECWRSDHGFCQWRGQDRSVGDYPGDGTELRQCLYRACRRGAADLCGEYRPRYPGDRFLRARRTARRTARTRSAASPAQSSLPHGTRAAGGGDPAGA